MSFSENSGVITQTGTDTDLSGLSGLTGVTTLSVGSGAFQRTTYSLSGVRLLVTGTLTMNSSSVEYLEFSSTAPDYSLDISATGTFTFGKQVTSGTVVRSGHPCGGIYFSKVYSTHYQGMAFRNAGTVYWYGVIGGRHVPISTVGSGSWIIRDGVLQSDEPIFAFGIDQPNLFFHQSGTVDIDGFTLHQESLFVRVNSGTITKFDNVRAVISQGVAQNASSTTPFELRGYSPEGNICDISVYRGDPQIRGVKSINSPLGNNVYVGGTDTTGQSYGWAEMWQEVVFDAKDTSGTSVNDVKMYLEDTDNGNRTPNYTGTDGILYSEDRVYEETFNGVSNQVDVLVGVVASTSGIARPGYDTGLSRVDRRGLSDTQGSRDNPSDFRFKLINYENTIIDSVIDITSDDVNTLNLTFVKDIVITETSKATVDAYTEIENPEKFYDRAKSYLYDNYAGEISTLVTRSGNLIDAGSYDVSIDAVGGAMAGSAFSVSANLITIKASTFTGDITTTGSITLLNGAINVGTLIDSGGTTTTLPYSITGLIAGSNVRIYNLTTNSEFYVGIVAGTSLSGTYTEGVEISAGDVIDIQTVNVNGTTAYYEQTVTVIASTSGLTGLVSQELNDIYNSNGIDGSTITGITLDVPNVEFDLDESDNTISSQEIYAWYMNELMTTDGIRAIYKAITPKSQYRYSIDPSVVDLKLDNKDLDNSLAITNGYFYRTDNTSVITSGSGNIEMIPNESYVADSTQIVSGLSSIESTLENLNDPTVQEIVDGVWDEPLTGATHNDPTSAGRRLRQASTWVSAEGEVVGTPTTTTVQTDLAQATSSFYSDQTFIMVTGALEGQARVITSYDGTTKTFTFDEPWTVAPSATDEFAILADHVHPVDQIQAGLALESSVQAIPTNPLLTNDARLDNIDATISSRSTFDHFSDEVITDSASREASKADISALGTSADLEVINTGVKKASKLIPHNVDLP